MKCKICGTRQAEIGYNICMICTLNDFHKCGEREIMVCFQLIKYGKDLGKPFFLTFATEDDLIRYLDKTSGHPFMELKIISKSYREKNEYLC